MRASASAIKAHALMRVDFKSGWGWVCSKQSYFALEGKRSSWPPPGAKYWLWRAASDLPLHRVGERLAVGHLEPRSSRDRFRITHTSHRDGKLPLITSSLLLPHSTTHNKPHKNSPTTKPLPSASTSTCQKRDTVLLKTCAASNGSSNVRAKLSPGQSHIITVQKRLPESNGMQEEEGDFGVQHGHTLNTPPLTHKRLPESDGTFTEEETCRVSTSFTNKKLQESDGPLTPKEEDIETQFDESVFLPKPPSRLGNHSVTEWAKMYSQNETERVKDGNERAKKGAERVKVSTGGVKYGVKSDGNGTVTLSSVGRKQQLLTLQTAGRNYTGRYPTKKTSSKAPLQHVTRHVTLPRGDISPPSSPAAHRYLRIGY